uniref:Uncharacterized protein n=1 Tax=Siphoviridae sp. ctCIv11 TaxID=2827806 RepID=A0A8S5S228_9CAUD|nr:MAG TPA: hypothetical protein [Siphoviridae sp. ctCIv11]DAH04915.1 MAG TPA: hypothetical protein [Bacteriophage sp.]DAQ54906.1 MAG TPA: hypothetical protein [Caudoviricetes sp.]DAV93216.1 MAG TPA: hypothetical protein [Caudoviricetes sp.]
MEVVAAVRAYLRKIYPIGFLERHAFTNLIMSP